MKRHATYAYLGLLSVTAALPGSMERFIAGQNLCLFGQNSDLSTATSRKAYDGCLMAKNYYLKEGCEVGATTPTCYEHRP